MTDEMEVNEDVTTSEDFDAAFDAAIAEARGDAPEVEAQAPEPEEFDDKDEFRVDQYQQVQEERATAPELALPQGWAEGDKELVQTWKTLPDKVKAIVNKRERDRTAFMHRETQKVQETYQKLAPIAGVLDELEPYRQKWALEGKPLGVQDVIRQAVGMREYIKNTPNLELAKQFLKASGKGPEALIEAGGSQSQRELQELREELNSLKNGRQQELQQQQEFQQTSQAQQLQAHALDAFHRFSQTRNAHGQLKYPSANQPGFAEAMGSLVSRRMQQVPGLSIEQHLAQVYAHMGGQIASGNGTSSSNNNRLREAAASGYGKGSSGSSPKVFDSYDDAFSATLEEFGLLE